MFKYNFKENCVVPAVVRPAIENKSIPSLSTPAKINKHILQIATILIIIFFKMFSQRRKNSHNRLASLLKSKYFPAY